MEQQAHTFLALDAPLGEHTLTELRTLVPRASLGPRSLSFGRPPGGGWNADRAFLRWFDLWFYQSEWGTRTLRLKLPGERVDAGLFAAFAGSGPALEIERQGAAVVLTFAVQRGAVPETETYGGTAAQLAPLRAELLSGDARALMLGWLASADGRDERTLSGELRLPPVPAGLSSLTEAQHALAEFLGLAGTIVDAAASWSPKSGVHELDGLRSWIQGLDVAAARALLLRAVDNPTLPLGAELRRTWKGGGAASEDSRPTLEQLWKKEAELRAEQERREQESAAEARARVDGVKAAGLEHLGANTEAAWAQLDAWVDTMQYDRAARLAVDLHEAADRGGAAAEHAARAEAFRTRWASRRRFLERWDTELQRRR